MCMLNRVALLSIIGVYIVLPYRSNLCLSVWLVYTDSGCGATVPMEQIQIALLQLEGEETGMEG